MNRRAAIPQGREDVSERERIFAAVERVPSGRVSTYGRIAAIASLPNGARRVGYALHSAPPVRAIPWHRVVNARGEISARSRRGPADGAEALQRAMLEAEGVTFSRDGRVDLDRFLWDPDPPPVAFPPTSRKGRAR